MNPIVCTWSTRLPRGSVSVWPDGCRDLVVIIDGNQPPRLMCCGLDVSVRHVVCTSETLFLGVRLIPGVTFPWDGADADTMHLDVALGQYLPSSVQHGGCRVDREEVLCELTALIRSLARPAPDWVAEYFQGLWSRRAGDFWSMSERSIRRRLVQATGAPPRFWYGLDRARKAGLEIARSDAALAAIAADHHFSDQAHMSREMRRWFGCTPMMLRTNRDHAVARLTAPNAFQETHYSGRGSW